MRRYDPRLTALGLACAGVLLAAAPVLAQSSMSNSSSSSSFGSGSPSSSSGSFGNTSSSGNSMFGNSSSFGNSNSSSGNSFLGGNTNLGSTQGTTGNVPGRTGTTSKPGTTSFLGPNYANPLAMGLGSNTSITSAGPAFGTALYTITTQTNTGRVTTSTTNQNNTSYGSGVGVRRLPAYATTLRIKDPPPPPTAAAVQLDLQNMIVQSPQLDSRNAIRVLIDGQAVVLRGQVVDDEERRMVENMVRLTPGVGVVRNELAARQP